MEAAAIITGDHQGELSFRGEIRYVTKLNCCVSCGHTISHESPYPDTCNIRGCIEDRPAAIRRLMERVEEFQAIRNKFETLQEKHDLLSERLKQFSKATGLKIFRLQDDIREYELGESENRYQANHLKLELAEMSETITRLGHALCGKTTKKGGDK